LGYGLASDAKGNWTTTNGCEYVAAGAGTTIRGRRADLWTYYNSDLMSRLRPGGIVVLVTTPMHLDDLMGRLQRVEGDDWYVLEMPAISRGDGDALGRAEGVPLWSDQPGYGYAQDLLRTRDGCCGTG
jgi:hypothetical protein